MSNQLKKKDLVSKLRDACFELNALAYLIKQKREDTVPPHEIEDINYGIGQILDRLTSRVRRVMIDLEDGDIEEAVASKATT